MIPNTALGHKIKALQAFTATVLRAGRGIMGTATPMQPEQALILYEYEACPYARRVREVMTYLNLDYESRPSPKNGLLYRNELQALAGKTQVPFFIDTNTDTQILESQAIIEHLFAHYSAKGSIPKKYQKPRGKDNASLLNKIASVSTMMRGFKAVHPKQNEARGKPAQPLHLYGFEASPFCRLIRERLCELEVGYINHNVAREQLGDMGAFGRRFGFGEYQPITGGKRERIKNEEMAGKLQFPYLVDPNTDTQIYESKDIIDYLEHNYG